MEMPPIFYEVHSNLPREGPGDNKSTDRAFKALKNLPPKPRILDIGCGPGMQTIELAKLSCGQIEALDSHQPFLEIEMYRKYSDYYGYVFYVLQKI